MILFVVQIHCKRRRKWQQNEKDLRIRWCAFLSESAPVHRAEICEDLTQVASPGAVSFLIRSNTFGSAEKDFDQTKITAEEMSSFGWSDEQAATIRNRQASAPDWLDEDDDVDSDGANVEELDPVDALMSVLKADGQMEQIAIRPGSSLDGTECPSGSCDRYVVPLYFPHGHCTDFLSFSRHANSMILITLACNTCSTL